MTIKELLKEGSSFLGASDTSILDVEVILAFVLGVERDYLIPHDDEEVEEALVDLCKKYLIRVKDGEPVAHIINEKEFYGLNFFVDERVLIPRPETEHLVEEVLDFLRESEQEEMFRLIDVGTGSGNIAVSIAKVFGDDGGLIDFDAVDISEEALEVARVNAAQHAVEDRVRIYQSDLLENVDDGEEFDVIVANLPYIGEVKHHFVSKEAEKYEPNVALFGGEDGLQLYKKMFQQIQDKNVEFKLLLGEFGFAQGDDMRALLNKYFEHKWEVKKDLAGIDRMFIVKF